jgi:hypothetical protein
MMESLNYYTISLETNFNMGVVCTRLNYIIGTGPCFFSFAVQNAMFLSLVGKIVTTMDNDVVFCGAFGLYPAM